MPVTDPESNTALAVSICALAVSGASLVWQTVSFRLAGAARIKVRLQPAIVRGQHVYTGKDGGWNADIRPLDETYELVRVQVHNKGRAAVTVTDIRFRFWYADRRQWSGGLRRRLQGASLPRCFPIRDAEVITVQRIDGHDQKQFYFDLLQELLRGGVEGRVILRAVVTLAGDRERLSPWRTRWHLTCPTASFAREEVEITPVQGAYRTIYRHLWLADQERLPDMSFWMRIARDIQMGNKLHLEMRLAFVNDEKRRTLVAGLILRAVRKLGQSTDDDQRR